MKVLFVLVGLLFIGSCEQHSEKEENKELTELMDRIKTNKDTNAMKELMEKADDSNGFFVSTSKDVDSAHFRIVFPCANIQEKTLKMNSKDGRFNVYQIFANRQYKSDDNFAYSVNYHFLENTKDQQVINSFFDNQRDDLLSRVNGKLESELIIELQGIEGRKLYISLDHMDTKMTTNFYYRYGVFYNITVITPNEYLFNKKSSNFLKSFKFI